MMDCTRYVEMMQKELDGELSELEVKILEKHLSQCPSCAEEYHAFRLMADMLGDLEPVEPPVDLKSMVMAEIMQMEVQPAVTTNPSLSREQVEVKTVLTDAEHSKLAVRKKGLGFFITAAIVNAIFFSYWLISLTGLGFNRYHALAFYQIMMQSFSRFVVIGRYTGEAVQLVLKALAQNVPWHWVCIYLALAVVLVLSLYTWIRRKGGDLT